METSSVNDPETALRRCLLLRFLQPEVRQRLAEIAWMDVRAKGYRFFDAGDRAPGLFIVVSGMARVFQLNAQGKEHVLHLPGPGDTFAEVAVLGNFPVPAYAEMIQEGVVLMLPADQLQQQLASDHDLCRQLLGGMAMWVRHLVGMVEDIALRDAAGRLARWLLEHTDETSRVRLPMAKRHLASQLALTPETLSRCLRRLEESDLIRIGDDQILLVDPEGLEATAAGMGPLV